MDGFRIWFFYANVHTTTKKSNHLHDLIHLCFSQGRILTIAGVTTAICSAPFVGFMNLIALAVWPSWLAVAISETLRKVTFRLHKIFVFIFKGKIFSRYPQSNGFWKIIHFVHLSLQVVTYVVTRPGRELLFTVVSQDEKYKAKVCIDVIVQRLGDATAAGMYKLLFSTTDGNASTVSLYALPVRIQLWLNLYYSYNSKLVICSFLMWLL